MIESRSLQGTNIVAKHGYKPMEISACFSVVYALK